MGMKFFPSRWPIMCAAMNQVSDLSLALAVQEAGAMPSLVISGDNRVDRMNSDLHAYVQTIGNANIVLCLHYGDLVNVEIVKLVKQYKVSHIELLGSLDSLGMSTRQEFDHMMSKQLYRNGLKFLRSTAKIMIRILTPTAIHNDVHAYALKGSDSAGFGGKLLGPDLFNKQIQLTPNMNLIPYGGIGTPQQVSNYIKQGAAAVAVGTSFAATKESCLAQSTKQQMIIASAKDLTKFTTSQQALVLGEQHEVVADATPNRQHSLNAGVTGHGGLVYAGSAIDQVTSVRTVKEVVEYLCEDLE